MSSKVVNPIRDKIETLYDEKIEPLESLEMIRNLTGLVEVLLECVKDNEIELDDHAV